MACDFPERRQPAELESLQPCVEAPVTDKQRFCELIELLPMTAKAPVNLRQDIAQ
jgi:hypothetical protein